MSDCDFFPDDPACNQDSIPPPAGYMADEVFGDYWKGSDKADPLKGQLTYLFVATAIATNASLGLFRYRLPSSYYADGEIGSWNPWKVANLIEGYGLLVISALAFITQILSLFGIAANVNLIVWVFGVGLGGALVAATASVLRFVAFDKAFQDAAGAGN